MSDLLPYPSNGLRARPPEGFVALVCLTDFKRQGKLFLSHNPRSMFEALKGRILAVGGGVPELNEGDVVLYTAGSAHPGQDRPLDASWFGGEEGDAAFLIPCYTKPLKNLMDSDQELGRMKERLKHLEDDWRHLAKKERNWLIPKDVVNELGRLRKNIAELELMRYGARRNRSRTLRDDDARSEGIIAVVEGE